VSFKGAQLDTLPIDEIRVARLFQTLLDPEHSPQYAGISITAKSFREMAASVSAEGVLFLLTERGDQFQTHLPRVLAGEHAGGAISFVLGDHMDLEREEEDFLIETLGAIPISLGAKSYLASHCIVFLLMTLQKYKVI
jgi:tRNA pseudouridine-54 N-methylase